MKKIILICLFLLVIIIYSRPSAAQNLIYNGSFEERESIFLPYQNTWSDCPTQCDHEDNPQLPKARGWSNPEGYYPGVRQGYTYKIYSTSDFFHTCNMISTSAAIPKSDWITGYQCPRTGEGFAASVNYIYAWGYSEIIIGEFIQTKLKDTLLKDSLYILTYYVNRGNLCTQSINAHGAFLSSHKIWYSNLLGGIINGNVLPQVLSNRGYISDTLNWTKIQGVFKAKGDEIYISIGNFDYRKGIFRTEENDPLLHRSASYAIDDISLYPLYSPTLSAQCGNDTTICLGNSFRLGKVNIDSLFKSEYHFEWFISGQEDSIFSIEEHPIVAPQTTTTYILKCTDFRYVKTCDTIQVMVHNCQEPAHLKVYPVPTFDIVNFEFDNPYPDLIIELYDVRGKLIRKYPFTQNQEGKTLQINLNAFATGMYFYSIIIQNERRFNGKFVLLK